jgi:hypothetical protein
VLIDRNPEWGRMKQRPGLDRHVSTSQKDRAGNLAAKKKKKDE